jgi:sulfofructose kinase
VHVDHRGAALLGDLKAAGAKRLSVDAGNPGWDLDLRGLALFAPTRRFLAARYPGRTVPAAIDEALTEGAVTVVVTDGARGAVGARGDERVRVPAVRVDVRSTLGAGDVFHGALLAAFVRGLDLRPALAFASAAAALSCAGLDGRSAIPTSSDVERVLADAA